MTDSPHYSGACPHLPGTRPWSSTDHPLPEHTRETPEPLILRLEQRAPTGVGVKDLRPLRGRPAGAP